MFFMQASTVCRVAQQCAGICVTRVLSYIAVCLPTSAVPSNCFRLRIQLPACSQFNTSSILSPVITFNSAAKDELNLILR